MIWDYFIWFAAVSALLWITGSVLAWRDRRSPALVSYIAGTLVFFSFMIAMWVALERPPMRTMGETRLWYSFFMAVAGIIVYSRWKYKWILSFSTIMALVYITVNLLKPQIHTKSLMPALQSPWFAPHVIVYMFSYGMLGAATIMALYVLIFKKDDVRDAFRGPLGTGGLGNILGLGSERDLGGDHMADLSPVCPLQDFKAQGPSDRHVDPDPCFHLPADLLVGDQLPALGPRDISTRLLILGLVCPIVVDVVSVIADTHT